MPSRLEKEFQYYLDNRDELVEKYEGKVLIIKDGAVVSAHDTENEALLEARKKFQAGTYLVQLCSGDEESHIQHFHSRACFNC